VSSPGPTATRRWALPSSGRADFPGYPTELRQRAEQVLNGNNLVEVALYGHLLLEQALEILIRARLKRPGVFEERQFPRLGFAQKIMIYAGLYDPSDDQISLLQAFNRLRNRMAHSFADLDESARRDLPGPDGDTAIERVQRVFLWLAFFELGVIETVHRVDLEEGIDLMLIDCHQRDTGV
jgi:hypothetical protein